MKVMPNAERTAFPTFIGPEMIVTGGLSKRELFAAMAMQGMLANGAVVYAQSDIETNAVERADLLLAALKDRSAASAAEGEA